MYTAIYYETWGMVNADYRFDVALDYKVGGMVRTKVVSGDLTGFGSIDKSQYNHATKQYRLITQRQMNVPIRRMSGQLGCPTGTGQRSANRRP